LTFVQSLESRRKSLQEFCDQAINALFDVAVADVDARIAALSEASARDAQRDADRQYERGLLSEEDRANARLKLSSAELAREQASWVLEDAHRQLAVATALAWQASLLPAAPDFVVPTDQEPWTRSDLGLRRAEIALRIAEFDVAGLPRNAAPYDRRIAEAALRKATVALEQARRASERSFTSLAQTLRDQASTLSIRSGELELQRSLLEDAARRQAQRPGDRRASLQPGKREPPSLSGNRRRPTRDGGAEAEGRVG